MESIVLARHDFREWDQIISLYTKDAGKQEVLARGVKKIVSKNAAHLEPFSFVLVGIVPGKEIDHLTKVQSVDSFPNIRKDMTKSLSAQYVVSLANKMLQPNEPDKRVFELLKSWLRFVAESDMVAEILIDGFVVKLLGLLGFSPFLLACAVCGVSYQQMMKDHVEHGSTLGFSVSLGGLLCERCRKAGEDVGEKSIRYGLKDVSAMNMLIHGDWWAIRDFAVSEEEKHRLHKCVYAFALFHNEKHLVDWSTCFSFV
jgi:DNA repair protein RecO (recombination protein O)